MSESATITATEANRHFSRLLRNVERGQRVTITSHGRPVAYIEPAVDREARKAQRLKALEALKATWATQEHVTIGPWTRDDLHDRDW